METEKTRTITVDGRDWWFAKDLPKHQLWHSNYFCSDGDGVELYIEKDNGGFELVCFSGISASKIFIDDVDFEVFKYAPNKIETLDFNESFEMSCLKIADHLCRIFCEYIPPKP